MDNFYEDVMEETDIQEILDAGYDLLGEFQIWIEKSLKIDSDTSQQDLYNVESLMEYLAYRGRRSLQKVDEFHLRWFVFSHYIRHSNAGKETEEHMPESLKRLYYFLQNAKGMFLPDWIEATLEDQSFYIHRRTAFREMNGEDEAQWIEEYRTWSEEMDSDLDSRCLLLPREITENILWGDKMGWREATLFEEANNLWQKERTELLLDGLDFESIRYDITSSYELWLSTPQIRLDDATPIEMILQERAETETHNQNQDE